MDRDRDSRDRRYDRDRDRDRDYDRNTFRLGAGESYRPGGDPPPRPAPRYRSPTRRSPPRRDSSQVDTYIPGGPRAARPRSRSPGGFRRRSRSPRGAGGYRDTRARSSRRDSPPRDDDRRGPPPRRSPPREPREQREYGRDIVRDRDMRMRDRSPPPLRRDASPRGRYDPRRSPETRDYSPPPRDRVSRERDERRDFSERRRSPSPRRPARDDFMSGRDSHATSRMSSPPGYPPRDRDDRDYREREYDSRERDDGYRNGDEGLPVRAPPTGPAANRSHSSPISIPTGPSVLSAPSRPRGGAIGRGGYPRDDYRDYGPPTGPSRRGSGYNYPPPRGGYAGPRGGGPMAFRGSGNSTSSTYPRTQRFNNAPQSSSSSYLSDLPPLVPGGQKLPDVVNMSKIEKLEEEARRLRESIEAREMKKREAVRDWDRLERENRNAALRSELAEEHLRKLNGESDLGDRAF